MAKRSYGTGRLYVVVDRGGRASWYGSWWVGGTRVERKIGLKRTTGNADDVTRTQAERELRRLVDATTVAKGRRRTVGEAGDAYVAHLENVMERKRTTVADYRGYLCRDLAPPLRRSAHGPDRTRTSRPLPGRKARRRPLAQDGPGAAIKTSSCAPGDRPRTRRLHAAQALPGCARPRACPRPDLPRTASHVRHADGRGRGAAARGAGVDGARRRQHDGGLRSLRARSDRRCSVRATCVRLRHRRAGSGRRCPFRG